MALEDGAEDTEAVGGLHGGSGREEQDVVESRAVEDLAEESGELADLAGLVVGVVSLVTLALLAWQARRKGRELAKLKHERDRLKHEEIRSRMAAEALKDKVLIDKHIEVYKALKEEISLLAVKVAEIDQQEQEALEKIDAIKNWEEVDSYLGSDRMPTARDRDSPGTP